MRVFLSTLFLACMFLASCKKNTPNELQLTVATDLLENASDSLSFNIDGIPYLLNSYQSYSVNNLHSNCKIDSIVKHNYYISGDKDSLLLTRSYFLTSTKYDQTVEISFSKKYALKDMKLNPFVYEPNNKLDMFTIGKRQFILDFKRENAHNGVTIRTVSNSPIVNEYYQSYIDRIFGEPTTIGANNQQSSVFEILNLKILKSGKYLLEAKFNTTVFDKDEKSRKLENGYLRITLPSLE
jgi:hypothetical protein